MRGNSVDWKRKGISQRKWRFGYRQSPQGITINDRLCWNYAKQNARLERDRTVLYFHMKKPNNFIRGTYVSSFEQEFHWLHFLIVKKLQLHMKAAGHHLFIPAWISSKYSFIRRSLRDYSLLNLAIDPASSTQPFFCSLFLQPPATLKIVIALPFAKEKQYCIRRHNE